MPLFEYKCTECGELNAMIRAKVNRDDKLVCSVCGGFMSRQLSAPQQVDVINFGKDGY